MRDQILRRGRGFTVGLLSAGGLFFIGRGLDPPARLMRRRGILPVMNGRHDDDRRSRSRGLDDSVRDLSNAAAQLLGALVDLLDDARRALQGRRPD